jgi:hypothetical protein
VEHAEKQESKGETGKKNKGKEEQGSRIGLV